MLFIILQLYLVYYKHQRFKAFHGSSANFTLNHEIIYRLECCESISFSKTCIAYLEYQTQRPLDLDLPSHHHPWVLQDADRKQYTTINVGI